MPILDTKTQEIDKRKADKSAIVIPKTLILYENEHTNTTEKIARIEVTILRGLSWFFKIIIATKIAKTGVKYLTETATPISSISIDL